MPLDAEVTNSDGGQKPESLIKQTLLIFTIASVTLYAIGYLVMELGARWVGQPLLQPADIAQFIYAENLNPKPLERLVFLSVSLSVVPVLALTSFWVRNPPAWFLYLRLPAAIRDFPKSPGTTRLAQRFAMGLVMIYAIYVGGYNRWFGADEVGDKFISTIHFDAVTYSIMRISQGGTCLADVMPQYGCYGEFFKPVWSVVPASVGAITTIFFFLYLVSIFAATQFAAHVIRKPEIVLACGLSLVTLSFHGGAFDPYLQYWPIRTLFPCLALWLATTWEHSTSGYKALAFGAFSAFAIGWNLDSGFPVSLSLAALIVLSGCTKTSSLREFLSRKRFLHLGMYALGVTVTLIILLGYLSLKSGGVVDPGQYFRAQRIFYVAGFMMLPMPPPLPHPGENPWGLVVLVMLFAASAAAVRAMQGRANTRYELIGFAAILSLGVFVYYTGRSHIAVLKAVSWLPLILMFCIADLTVSDSGNKAAGTGLRLIGVGVAVLLLVSSFWLDRRVIADRWIEKMRPADHAALLVADADFIDRDTKTGDKIALLAPNQSSLTLAAHRVLYMSGTGMTETALWSEATRTDRNLREHGPKDFFLDQRILGDIGYSRIFSAFESDVRAAYVTRDWEPNGHLLHMVRRQSAADHDEVPFEGPATVNGRPRDFPLFAAKDLKQSAFQLEMNVIADPQQGRFAVLASSTNTNDEFFRGLIIYRQSNMAPEHWVLAIGNGSAWRDTPPFVIPSGRPVTLKVSYASPGLEIDVGGKVVFNSAKFASMAPTKELLYVGDWVPHLTTNPSIDTTYGYDDFWTVQDNRFNGEVTMARLLPFAP